MNYELTKSSRLGGTPYLGQACFKAGTPPAHIYADKSEAALDAKKMEEFNPMGFVVQETDEADLAFAARYKKACAEGRHI